MSSVLKPTTASRGPKGPIVYIVSDDSATRDALALLIESAGWRQAMFRSASDFLTVSPSPSAKCVVVDEQLPDQSGFDLQNRIARERPRVPVIFVTDQSDVPAAVKAMRAGALEVLTKPISYAIAIEAIELALDRSNEALSIEAEVDGLRRRWLSLTAREQQVLELIVTGLLNKQVGYELGISEITVKAHRGRVMRKMGAPSFADLVRMAGTLGLQEGCRRPPLQNVMRNWSQPSRHGGAAFESIC